MNYIVLGSAGQLGRDLCPRLSGKVIPLTRDSADLTQPEGLRAVLIRERPDVVINCAAYNLVDRAESEPEAAFAVNAWGVRHLALICRDLDCLLVHFSTDYVFGLDEARRTPWAEDDAPGPVSVYGLSKLAGEYLVRSLCPRHIVIRTCGLYGVWGSGGKGGNFVETMLRLASQGRPLRVVADQVCTPTYTVDVAEATIGVLASFKGARPAAGSSASCDKGARPAAGSSASCDKGARPAAGSSASCDKGARPAAGSSAGRGQPGLYHVTNAGSCSWYEFAQAIFDFTNTSADLTAISSQEYGAAARRPVYSVLAPRAITALGLPLLRPWREALAAYLAERQQRAPGQRP
jgi:dTDP-4-dehydrorhamnose reductase